MAVTATVTPAKSIQTSCTRPLRPGTVSWIVSSAMAQRRPKSSEGVGFFWLVWNCVRVDMAPSSRNSEKCASLRTACSVMPGKIVCTNARTQPLSAALSSPTCMERVKIKAHHRSVSVRDIQNFLFCFIIAASFLFIGFAKLAPSRGNIRTKSCISYSACRNTSFFDRVLPRGRTLPDLSITPAKCLWQWLAICVL